MYVFTTGITQIPASQAIGTSICQLYNLSAETLLYKWEALNFRPSATRSEISEFTMDSIIALKAQIQRDIVKENAKRPQHRAIGVTNTAIVNRSRLPVNMHKTAVVGQNPTIAQMKVEEGFGVPGPSKSSSVVFKGPANDPSSRKYRSYRYMYEKILERSEALDDRIEEFSELIKEHYNVAELGDPTSGTDVCATIYRCVMLVYTVKDDIIVTGRIVYDADTADTAPPRLTETSMALEASRANGGKRVALRLDSSVTIRGAAQGAGSVGLFPGSIVALKGKNGGGNWFLVKEILSLPPLKPSPTSFRLPSIKSDSAVDPSFSIHIACGPYTPDADLSYKPWRALVKTLKASKPSVVLLMGPFIDVQHPKIKTGETDMLPDALFRSLFIEHLRTYLDSSPGSIAVLVPSIRDLISRQAVYPQGELDPELTASDPRIHLLPNPSRFSINDITFGVTSVDVVYHLKKEELSIKGAEVDPIPSASPDDTGTDVMANTCRHILQQRSFYPLFPVPLDVSHEVNLSVTHLDGLRLADGTDNPPDILILPSRLKQFSKVVQTTTMINPSFLSKGTFAKLDIAAGSTDSYKERIKTEVVKLEA
ncbi:DNA polymerase alpha subunit B [Termitomyces sp. J132]|nr:DNA polymerase alpha subunit B [Termitomyces sp. J132]